MHACKHQSLLLLIFIGLSHNEITCYWFVVGVGTKIDPILCRADRLVGQVSATNKKCSVTQALLLCVWGIIFHWIRWPAGTRNAKISLAWPDHFFSLFHWVGRKKGSSPVQIPQLSWHIMKLCHSNAHKLWLHQQQIQCTC